MSILPGDSHTAVPAPDGTAAIDRAATGILRGIGILLRVVLPVSILAGGVAACWWFAKTPAQTQADAPEPEVLRTRVVALDVCNYPVVIRTHGIVQPHNEVTLSAQVAGEVLRISPRFESGAYFEAGDVLVELDDRDYRIALQIAKARQVGAESTLQLARLNYDRSVKLSEKSVVSEANVNEALASRLLAEAELESAVAQVERAQRDLDRTKIVSTFAGRVREKSIGIGQTLSPGAPLGVVFAVDFAEVRLPIAGNEMQFLDLPELENDPPIDVELSDSIAGNELHRWRAQIIRTEGVLDEDSLELFAIARIEDPFGREFKTPPLHMGQPVVARIVGKTLTDVVAIPRNAVRQLDQVLLVSKSDHTLSSKSILPIYSDETHIVVRDPSIRRGDLLATTHLVYAPEGSHVEILPDPEQTVRNDAAAAKPMAIVDGTN